MTQLLLPLVPPPVCAGGCGAVLEAPRPRYCAACARKQRSQVFRERWRREHPEAPAPAESTG